MGTTDLARRALVLVSCAMLACSGAPPDDGPTQQPQGTQAEGTPTVEATQAPTISVSLSEDTLSFGSLDPGDPATKELIVQNTGNTSITLVEAEVTGVNSSWFRVSGLGLIRPQASITLLVTFSPTSFGDANCQVFITANPAEGGFDFAVEGSGSCSDKDGDGQCSIDTGGDDCDDSDRDVYYDPNGEETCDGKDNDCNGEIDDDAVDADSWYRDNDNDGYGTTSSRELACSEPTRGNWAPEGGDCEDGDPEINPGVVELCDGYDNNCKGGIDEDNDFDGDGSPDCSDDDGDGYCEGSLCIAADDGSPVFPGDCDDDNADANPAPEQLELPGDGIDNNCNGEIDENSPPQVSFVNPAQPDQLQLRDEPITLIVDVVDPEDGSGVGVTITSDLDDELCFGVTGDDGRFSCSVQPSFGVHALTAVATDSNAATGSAIASLLVDTPPEISVVYPRDGDSLAYGATITYNALASDPDPEQEDDALEFTWTSSLSGVVATGVAVNGFALADVTLAEEGDHLLTFAAKDAFGAVSEISLTVTVTEPDCTMNKGLVALYHFDEGGSGATSADASGNNLTAALGGGATFTSNGKFGGGVAFDGASAFVEINNTADLLSLQTFTIESWVQFTSSIPLPTVVRQPIFNKGSVSAAAAVNYELRVNNAGVLETTIQKASGPPAQSEITAEGTSTFARNQWHLMTATFDGVNLRLYVDGVLDGETTTATVSLQEGDAPLYLGTDSFTTTTQARWLNGIMDEARVLNCALTERQILEGYELGEPHQVGGATEPTPTPEGTSAP